MPFDPQHQDEPGACEPDEPDDRTDIEKYGDEPFPMLDLQAMLALPPPKWLVKNLLPQTGLALIFGESNTFKSFVGIDISCHIVHGMKWGEQKVEQGAVLYLAGDGGLGVARLRGTNTTICSTPHPRYGWSKSPSN
jgi:hypothetical protein